VQAGNIKQLYINFYCWWQGKQFTMRDCAAQWHFSRLLHFSANVRLLLPNDGGSDHTVFSAGYPRTRICELNWTVSPTAGASDRVGVGEKLKTRFFDFAVLYLRIGGSYRRFW